MSEPEKHLLITRWNGHEEELQSVINIIREDPKWYGTDEYKELLHTVGFSDAGLVKDLSGANLCGANFRGVDGSSRLWLEGQVQMCRSW